MRNKSIDCFHKISSHVRDAAHSLPFIRLLCVFQMLWLTGEEERSNFIITDLATHSSSKHSIEPLQDNFGLCAIGFGQEMVMVFKKYFIQ